MSTIDLTTDTFTVHQEDDLAIVTLLKGAMALTTTVSGKEGLLDAMNTIKTAPQIKGLAVLYTDKYQGDDEYKKFLQEILEEKQPDGEGRYSITFKSALIQFQEKVITFPKPIVGGLGGNIEPNSFAINLVFDMRIVADNACVFHPNLKFGLPVSPPLAYHLVQIFGSPKATELMLTKSEFSAQEILDLGLINQIVPKADLKKACIDKLRQLSTIPENTLVESRRMLQPDIKKMHKYCDEGFDATVRCLNLIRRSGA